MRKQVYIDTMGFHPALIRASVDILGADHVIAGSDWPIVNEGPIRDVLTTSMQQANLSDDEQQAIAAGNCQRLLGIR
jgi:predicted TIM-barrel fold metal-dependent hydrolase